MVRTLSLERVLCPKFCGKVWERAPILAQLCTAQATHFLILLDFTLDPFLVALFGTFTGSHRSQQPLGLPLTIASYTSC